jgi:hypothetical protein
MRPDANFRIRSRRRKEADYCDRLAAPFDPPTPRSPPTFIQSSSHPSIQGTHWNANSLPADFRPGKDSRNARRPGGPDGIFPGSQSQPCILPTARKRICSRTSLPRLSLLQAFIQKSINPFIHQSAIGAQTCLPVQRSFQCSQPAIRQSATLRYDGTVEVRPRLPIPYLKT